MAIAQWPTDRLALKAVGLRLNAAMVELREDDARVFHSSPCRPLFIRIELNQLSLKTRTHCSLILRVPVQN